MHHGTNDFTENSTNDFPENSADVFLIKICTDDFPDKKKQISLVDLICSFPPECNLQGFFSIGAKEDIFYCAKEDRSNSVSLKNCKKGRWQHFHLAQRRLYVHWAICRFNLLMMHAFKNCSACKWNATRDSLEGKRRMRIEEGKCQPCSKLHCSLLVIVSLN